MKKIIKSKIFAFILGAIIFGSIGVVSAYSIFATDIGYTPKDTTWKKANGEDITNVNDAIDELYNKASLISNNKVYPLYYRGYEEDLLTGGWAAEIKSTNSKWASGYNDYGKNTINGNGTYSSATITKSTKSVIITTSHNSSGGYGETEAIFKTNKAVNFNGYSKLYINLLFSTSKNANYFIELIDEQGNVAYQAWKSSNYECEINLTNYKSKPYYIYFFMTSQFSASVTGNLEIKSIVLEK